MTDLIIDTIAAKAVPANAPAEDFADPPSGLYIGDFEHACLAAQAVTHGLEGNKHHGTTQEMKDKIAAALRSKCPDDQASKDRRDKWLAALHGDSSKAVALDISDYTGVVKSLGDNRFGGYGLIWGNAKQRDLTPYPNRDGSKGEWFEPDTEGLLDVFAQLGKIPAFYHHGANETVKATLSGMIDTMESDNIGVWVEGELNKRNRYMEGIKAMIARGALQFSSGTLPLAMRKAPNGKITRWPLTEVSMTTSPMEPRGTDVSLKSHLCDERDVRAAYKALNLQFPVDLFGQEQDDVPKAAQKSSVPVHVPAQRVDIDSTKATHEDHEMTPEETKTAIAEAVAEALGAQKAQNAADVLKGEIEELKKQLAAAKNPPKQLPALPAQVDAPAQPAKARQIITVSDELRWAGASAADVAFAAMFVSEAGKAMDNGSPFRNTTLGQTALAMRERWFVQDPERRMERRIAAKTLMEWPEAGYAGFVPFLTPNDAMVGAVKANELDSSQQSAAVVDWVPQVWSQQIILRARIANPLQALLTQVQMTSNPYNLPIESTDPTAFHMPEGTDSAMLVLGSGNVLNLSKVASSKLQLTSTKIGARLGFSTEVQEDALPFVVMQFGRQVVRVVINGIDDTLINGDTVVTASTNINLIDGTPTTTVGARPTYLALDGIRKYGLLTNTTQKLSVGGSLTLPIIRQARFSLNAQYSVDLGNLALIVDAPTYRKMLNMPEFLTYQNVGGVGSNISGYLPGGMPGQIDSSAANSLDPKPVGVIDGIPVYLSGQLALSQTSDGKISNTGGNNTASTALLIDRGRWFLGWRRGVEFDTFDQLKIFSDTIQMMASVRFALQPFDTACAFVMYNIT